MDDRYYAENSEYPRVVDKTTGYAVRSFTAYDDDSAKWFAGLLNDRERKDTSEAEDKDDE